MTPSQKSAYLIDIIYFIQVFLDVDCNTAEGHHTSAITHIYYKAITWLGVSDHKVGDTHIYHFDSFLNPNAPKGDGW